MREFPDGMKVFLHNESSISSKTFLANIGRLLDLMDYLKIEQNIDLTINKIADKQLANIFEALIGAIYLDGGIDPCKILILNTVWPIEKKDGNQQTTKETN